MPEGRAWAATLLAFFGLPTWYYTFYDFSYPHIIELAFLVPALAFFVRGVKKYSLRLIALSGALVGCGALVRMDALLYAAVFAVALRVRFKKARPCLAFLIPAVAVSSLQIAVWWHIFGTPLSPPYMFDKFVVPGVYAYHVLGGGLRGFFVWSPIALAGVIGWGLGLRAAATRMISLMGFALLVLYAIFYGSWSMWWAGSAAGQRFLIPLFPFIAYGLIIVFNHLARVNPRVRWSIAGMLASAVVVSLFLSFVYPLLFQKGEKESSSLVALLHTARREYGFPHPYSFQRILVRAFWHGPRVIHVFFRTNL